MSITQPKLPALLQDWCEIETVILVLAAQLNFFDKDYRPEASFTNCSNQMVNAIFAFIQQMVIFGVLQHDEDQFVYRWNPEYNWEYSYKHSTFFG